MKKKEEIHMMDENYCVEELQEARRLLYRAHCQVRCLEANLACFKILMQELTRKAAANPQQL